MDENIARAARLIERADGLLITAGAGMGVDSGLPDFRGQEGFWSAYPALGKARVRFENIASPLSFEKDPKLAWGFYGHRLKLYRETRPHDGFRVLLDLSSQMPEGAFVFTSNVDGHFQKAGFQNSRICEAHGSIHYLQCMSGCAGDIWTARDFEPVIDEERSHLLNKPPCCPHCGGLARPNILMFGDWGWLDSRERVQRHALCDWLARVESPVVMEVGAGTAIPTVRMFGYALNAPLIRVNPREAQTPRPRDIALSMGAREALLGIEAELRRRRA